MYTSTLKAYKRTDLESASKPDILDRLFDRLATDLRGGQAAIANKDVAQRAQLLDHAGRILTELIAALDHGSAPDLCANLAALYHFCLSCIARASVDQSAAPLGQALGVVATLRSAFAEANLTR
jgi:flagellar secretion chaperone FliS